MNPLSRLIEPALLAPLLQAIAVAMAVILLSLILVLVLQKIVLERRCREQDEAADRYAKALANGTRVEQLQVDPRRLSQRRALARALRAAGSDVAIGQLRRAPWYAELIRRLQADCARKAWGERAAAFEILEVLRATELRPLLEQAASRESHPQAYAACLRCLARFADQPSGLASLWNQLQAKPALSGGFNEGLFGTVIGALTRYNSPENAMQAVRQLLAGANPQEPLTGDLVRAIGKSGFVPLVPQLAALWDGPQSPKSLRIACVRAVGLLQPDHALLLNALSDRDWEIQASAAKVLRSTTPRAILALSDCLTSAAFYVRLNAATTLASLGREGRSAVESALASPDPFAREISRYALRALDAPAARRAGDSANAPEFPERANA